VHYDSLRMRFNPLPPPPPLPNACSPASDGGLTSASEGVVAPVSEGVLERSDPHSFPRTSSSAASASSPWSIAAALMAASAFQQGRTYISLRLNFSVLKYESGVIQAISWTTNLKLAAKST